MKGWYTFCLIVSSKGTSIHTRLPTTKKDNRTTKTTPKQSFKTRCIHFNSPRMEIGEDCEIKTVVDMSAILIFSVLSLDLPEKEYVCKTLIITKLVPVWWKNLMRSNGVCWTVKSAFTESRSWWKNRKMGKYYQIIKGLRKHYTSKMKNLFLFDASNTYSLFEP